MKYEINDETLAVMSFDEHKTRIIEEGEDYVVNDVPYSIMENSCRYFGSSLEGRLLGSKDMLGSIYNNGETVVVDCPYFSIKNQIFRCNMLDTISRNRKG